MTLKNIIISLETEKKRRYHVDKEFKKNNLDYYFFNAIPTQCIDDVLSRDNLIVDTTQLSKGEIACLLSHFSVWKYIVANNIDYCAIFEDDIFLGKNSEFFLKETNWIPSDGIVKLETMFNNCLLYRNRISLTYARSLFVLANLHYGSAGYIISHKQAVALIKLLHSMTLKNPVDIIIFSNEINRNLYKIYQLYPALVIQDKIKNKVENFPSTIEQDRLILISSKKPKETLTTIKKIKREAKRLIKDILNLLKIHLIKNKIKNIIKIIRSYKRIVPFE